MVLLTKHSDFGRDQIFTVPGVGVTAEGGRAEYKLKLITLSKVFYQ